MIDWRAGLLAYLLDLFTHDELDDGRGGIPYGMDGLMTVAGLGLAS